ncbi:HEAT repeat domain-containing protein [Candidatus Pristimantibacillus sp. PTI5]|uniref:HEAT repeat domain-containing protein n=1 Tax=Candidatus Pristimantibacillus sp. PTI5 TaxID=3400422 RepID=UPI003B02007D
MSDLKPFDANLAKLGSSNTQEAFAAIQALKNQGIQILPALIEQLRVSDMSVRTMIVVVLGEMGEAAAESSSQVATLMLEDFEQLRMASALTLTRIGSSSIPHLLRILASNDNTACFWAAWSMSFLDPSQISDKALEILRNKRNQPDSPIEVFAAEEAIGKIVGNRLQQ